MFCALLMSRYQVSVYRTNGPLVFFCVNNIQKQPADQRLCFRFIDSIFLSFLSFERLTTFGSCTVRIVSDLVGNLRKEGFLVTHFICRWLMTL